MLRLSYVWKSKDIWSVGCGYTGCDAINEWSFGGPYKELSVKVPGIDWRSLYSTLYIPRKYKILDKGIIC